MVGGIQPQQIDFYWPHVEEMLRPAIEHSQGEYVPDDVLDALRKSEMQLWVAHDDGGIHAAMVTTVLNSPASKFAVVLFLGGKRLRDCWPHWDWFLEWAKAQGCDAIQAVTRPGMTRLLKKRGFQFVRKARSGDLLHLELEMNGIRIH